MRAKAGISMIVGTFVFSALTSTSISAAQSTA